MFLRRQEFHCTISVYEGNYDHIVSIEVNGHSPSYCTISVYEGNYDLWTSISYWGMIHFIALFPFMKGITTSSSVQGSILSPCFYCTISVYEGNYDCFSQSFLNQINTFLLHYFRLWRELRLGRLSACYKPQTCKHYCTISVYEGNYD